MQKADPEGAAKGACHIIPCSVRGRQCVRIGNDHIVATIVLGGGHIALIQRADEVESPLHEDFGSPLWVPPWPTCDPAVAEAADEEVFGPGLEGKFVLQHIMGHNLCLDVFGDHSSGEISRSGLAFHGEAGQVTWKVTSVVREPDCASLTVAAHLRHTCLDVTRTFSVRTGCSTVKVQETMKNLVGFQRAMGRAEHVTFGAAWLQSRKVRFSTNADKGQTMAGNDSEFCPYASEADFEYPSVPTRTGSSVDWREYPQSDVSEGLCTMRITPEAKYGWFVGEHTGKDVALAYVWEREKFPWLVTWEENCARQDKPWNGKVLTRGLEFSSYAYPTSREKNVAMGSLLDTPCFQWLDAYEEQATVFYFSLQAVNRDSGDNVDIELRAVDDDRMEDPSRGFVVQMF